MKISIVLFGLLAWIGCSEEQDVRLSTEVLEAEATWTNMLAADGCDWHFAVISKDTSIYFVPDSGSMPKIESAIGKLEDYYSFTKVHVKYTKTGKQKLVLCGWNHKASYDEVNILEIRKL
jgi:hypothetical protein